MGELKWSDQPQETPERLTPYVHWWLEHDGKRLKEDECRPGQTELWIIHSCISENGKPACRLVNWDEAPTEKPDERFFGPGEGVIPWFLRANGRNPAYEPDCEPWADDGAELPEGDAAVILGIIDDGIAFAHERFRGRGRKNRFDYIWLQGAEFGRGCDLPFGRELLHAEIDRLLGAPDFDEEAFYRKEGLIDFRLGEQQNLAQRASHGTAVLGTAVMEFPEDGGHADTAAGEPGEPPEVVIMAVSLPTPTVHDTSGTFLDYFVMLGIDRILKRAGWLRAKAKKKVDVVINFSFELTAGPKDGTSPLALRIEKAIDEWKAAGEGELDFTIPAGNHRQSRVHAHLESRTSESAWLTWHLQPDDRTASFVEIWMPPYPARPQTPTMLCEVLPPGYDEAESPRVPIVCEFNQHTELVDGGRLLARAYYSWHPWKPKKPDGPGRERIVVVAPPTAADSNARGERHGPPGDWRLRLHDVAGLKRVSADLYVQRDDTLFGGRRGGRQSYFDDDPYEDYDPAGRPMLNDHVESGVTRRGTLNAYALSQQAQLVGAAEREALNEMQYSGAGPTPAQAGPDYVAVVDESPVHWGTIVAGTFSGSKVLMTGTSLAAPRVARFLTQEKMRPPGAAASESASAPLPKPEGPSGPARTDRTRGKEVLKVT